MFAIGFKNIIFETNINNKTQKDGQQTVAAGIFILINPKVHHLCCILKGRWPPRNNILRSSKSSIC